METITYNFQEILEEGLVGGPLHFKFLPCWVDKRHMWGGHFSLPKSNEEQTTREDFRGLTLNRKELLM